MPRRFSAKRVAAQEFAMLVRVDPGIARQRLRELFPRVRFSKAAAAVELGVVPGTLAAWVTTLGMDGELAQAARAAGFPWRRVAGPRSQDTSVVYFLRAGVEGPIKIGWTTDIKRRTGSVQTGNHEELVVLATYPGDARVEARVHALFSADHIRGEWFRPSALLLEMVSYVAEGGSLLTFLENAEG